MNEEIIKLKNKIKDLKSYICSEYCDNPGDIYKEIENYEKRIIQIEKNENFI